MAVRRRDRIRVIAAGSLTQRVCVSLRINDRVVSVIAGSSSVTSQRWTGALVALSFRSSPVVWHSAINEGDWKSRTGRGRWLGDLRPAPCSEVNSIEHNTKQVRRNEGKLSCS